MPESGRAPLPRLVTIAVVTGLVVRLAFSLGYWVGKPLNHDEHEYLQLGESVAAGRGFTYDTSPPGLTEPERFGRAPLYPVFVAAFATITAPVTLVPVLKIAQSALGAWAIWLLALVARRAAGRRAAVGAAWIAALYPPLAWQPAFMLSESLYIVLALTNVVLLEPLLYRSSSETTRRRRSRAAATGLVGGLAALTRPVHVFFLALTVLWLLWTRRARMAALVALGVFIVIAPWTLRNYETYGRPVLIASEGGVTFWTGNHPLAIGEGDMAANPAIKRDNQRLRAAHPGLTPEDLEPIYYREAFSAIAARPGWWLQLEARKLFYLWVPVGPSYLLHSRLFLYVTWATYGVLLPLGMWGLWRLRTAAAPPVALGLLLAGGIVACLIFLPQERFRISVTDPALIVGAAALMAVRK